DSGHEKKEQPWLPDKKTHQGRLAELKEGSAADHEGEKPTQQHKDHKKDVRDRRRKITRQLAFRDCFDVSKTRIHFRSSRTVSGIVMLRNTSSSRPSSVCSSSTFHPSRAAVS